MRKTFPIKITKKEIWFYYSPVTSQISWKTSRISKCPFSFLIIKDALKMHKNASQMTKSHAVKMKFYCKSLLKATVSYSTPITSKSFVMWLFWVNSPRLSLGKTARQLLNLQHHFGIFYYLNFYLFHYLAEVSRLEFRKLHFLRNFTF